MNPTRILSWNQLVVEADPDFARSRLQPWIYQFSNGRRFYSPVNPYAPLPDSGLINDGGLLMFSDDSWIPQSDAGLYPGSVWSNGLACSVVAGGTPQPGAKSVIFFGDITASQLVLFGGANLPLLDPSNLGQLWISNGLIYVSAGGTPITAQFVNDGGVLTFTNEDGIPTTLDGQPPGIIYSNSLIVCIVPGFTPVPSAPLFFGSVTVAQLLGLTGIGLPTTPPTPGSLQLWNNAGIVCVA